MFRNGLALIGVLGALLTPFFEVASDYRLVIAWPWAPVSSLDAGLRAGGLPVDFSTLGPVFEFPNDASPPLAFALSLPVSRPALCSAPGS